MPTPLTPAERQELTSDLPEWEVGETSMMRTYEFADFTEAVAFVVKTAFAAEAIDHHPEIDIRWNRVTMRLSTHSVGALTSLDRRLASALDAVSR